MGSSPSAHSPKLPMAQLRLASAPPADGTDSGRPLLELEVFHLEAEGDDRRLGASLSPDDLIPQEQLLPDLLWSS